MKRLLLALLIALLGSGVGVTIVAAKHQPTLRPNTFIGPVAVGGLTPDDAARKLRVWWETERRRTLTLTSTRLKGELPAMTPGQLGIALDDTGSVAQVEVRDFWENASDQIGSQPEKLQLDVKFKPVQANFGPLKQRIKTMLGPVRPARVRYEAGQIITEPEVTSFELDETEIGPRVTAALAGDGRLEVPIKEAPKRIPDEELAKIREVVSQFSTTFPRGQVSRNTNIRLAAAKLNGLILMPGEVVSFNQTVGQRTAKAGYREAPVLVYGRHDTGIGGGICQVSTTLYNAALLSNLKIRQRQNHSLPSAYVPVGRDATVDWPNLDLKIENTKDTPIGITSHYEAGRITFRILGQKEEGLAVRIETANLRSWSRGEKVLPDPNLPAGRRRVIEKGAAGRSIDVYRVVTKNGVVVKREHLGKSRYIGSPRIVAVSTQTAPVAKKPANAAPAVATTPPVTTPAAPESDF